MPSPVVQSKAVTATTTGITVTMDATVQDGNTVVLIGNSVNTMSISGFNLAAQFVGDQGFYIWFKTSPGGETAYTVTQSSTGNACVTAIELDKKIARIHDGNSIVAGWSNGNSLTVTSADGFDPDGEFALCVVAMHGWTTSPVFASADNGFSHLLTNKVAGTGATGIGHIICTKDLVKGEGQNVTGNTVVNHTNNVTNTAGFHVIFGLYAANSKAYVNLCTNPAPANGNGWFSNNAANWVNSYSAGEFLVDRQAAAPANIAASCGAMGSHSPANPALKAGVNYQRSVEVWVDANGSVGNVGVTGAYVAGQSLVANTWNKVVQQFIGEGVARYVTAIQIDIPGVGTGVHVKLRKSMLIENPSGLEVPWFSGSSTDTATQDFYWNGTVNGSTSTFVDSTPLPPGVTERTNYATDPRYTTTSFKTSSIGTSGNAAKTIIAVADHPAGIITAYRATAIAAQGAINNIYVGAAGPNGVSINPLPYDKWVRGGAWVRMNVAHGVMFRFVWVNGPGGSNGPVISVPTNTWTWISHYAQCPGSASGITAVSVLGIVGTGPNPEINDTMDIAGTIVEVFNTQAEAEIPLTQSMYFDGSTPDSQYKNYYWTGIPDNSISVYTDSTPFGPVFDPSKSITDSYREALDALYDPKLSMADKLSRSIAGTGSLTDKDYARLAAAPKSMADAKITAGEKLFPFADRT